MAPKRARVTRGSEPPADHQPTRQTRGKKRRQSDASNVSTPSLADSHQASTPAKRRKHTKNVVEHDVAIEEEAEDHDEVAIASSDAKSTLLTSEGHHEVVSSQTTKEVHFDEVESENELVHTTASHMTPHPRKNFLVKRRITASPGVGESSAKRIEIKTSRRSLPPSLSQEDDSHYYEREELKLEYAPLNVALQERIERRAHVRRLRDQLAHFENQGDAAGIMKIQEELDAYQTAHGGDVFGLDGTAEVEEVDDDTVILVNQEISYPKLPIEHEDSEALVLHKTHEHREESFSEVERRKLKDAILMFSSQAEKAREERYLLEQELIGLGLAADSVEDPNLVLMSIRQTFREMRDDLTDVFPGDDIESCSNSELITVVMSRLKEYAALSRTQDKELKQRTAIIDGHGTQINYLLNRLAQAADKEESLNAEISNLEIRIASLNKRFQEVDKENEDKERENEDMLEQIHSLEEERETLQKTVEVKTKEGKVLYDENLEYAKNIVRLNDSLREYQAEKARLEKVVAEKEEDLAAQQEEIDELTARIEALTAELDAAKAELATTSALYAQEQQARNTTEETLQEKTDEVNDLETRVQTLEEELEKHTADLEELRQVNVSERQQREDAEAELDARGEEIASLTAKLEAKGLEANQLRQKLFEIQQSMKKEVDQLNEAAAAREEQYQTDIAAEIKRRETAEQLAADHADTIAELEAQIESLGEDIAEIEADRDARIEALRVDLDKEKLEVARLVEALSQMQSTAETTAIERDELKSQLDETVVALQNAQTTHANAIARLEQDAANVASLHDSEMEDFRSRVAQLNEAQASSHAEISRLEALKTSLEQRIAAEAQEMLLVQSRKDSEIDELQTAILERDEKMLNVIESAKQAEEHWSGIVSERDAIIAELNTTSQVQNTTITEMTMNMENLREKFRDYVARTETRFKSLQNAVDLAKAAVDNEGADQMDDNLHTLAELENVVAATGKMVVQTTTTTTTTTTNGKAEQQNGPASKKRKSKGAAAAGGRKRRVQDSGFYEMDEEGDEIAI